MKEYNSIPKFFDDRTLQGEQVFAFNKLDGQNFRVKYTPKGATKNQFTMFGSRHQYVDEKTENFGDAVKYFKQHYEDILRNIIIENSGKRGIFNGVDEITLFFEWYGDNSFCGFQQEGDKMHLALIDVFIKKKGYIEPKTFIELFYNNPHIETPTVVFEGRLNMDFINSIVNNDWTKEDCQYPNIKEGVVIKRSTLMKGQRLPMCKVKTIWWLNKLHNEYPQDRWEELE